MPKRRLKVWAGIYMGQRNALVAAYTQKDAAKSTRESVSGFRNCFEETFNAEHLAIATEPGLWLARTGGVSGRDFEKVALPTPCGS